MMKSLGHEVILYAGEQNEAPCDEHVVCVTEEKRKEMCGDRHFTEADWGNPLWRKFNNTVIAEMEPRLGQKDFICLIGGYSQKSIADYFSNHISVEFGIGYSGVFAQYKVFESYAWMHTVYGSQSGGDAATLDGKWYDTVIPNQFFNEDQDLAEDTDEEKYALYVGRLIDRKGYQIAQEVCKHKGIKLKLAGPGEDRGTGYGEFVGEVNPKERATLMKNAIALFAPTRYIEPFGTVTIEAMSHGTPVISTDWGAFTETVQNGIHGYRCRTFQDFIDALDKVENLDRTAIKEYANSRFSMAVVAKQYEKYFNDLYQLWEKGWYTVKE